MASQITYPEHAMAGPLTIRKCQNMLKVPEGYGSSCIIQYISKINLVSPAIHELF